MLCMPMSWLTVWIVWFQEDLSSGTMFPISVSLSGAFWLDFFYMALASHLIFQISHLSATEQLTEAGEGSINNYRS